MKDWQDDVFESQGTNNRQGIFDLTRKLLSNWYWFVLCGIIGFVVANTHLRYSTPIYRISARVLVTNQQGGSVIGQGAFGGSNINSPFGGSNSVDNEAEVFKTRYLMQQVVRKLNAQVNYFHPGRVRDIEIHRPPFQMTLLGPDSVRGGTFLLEAISDRQVRIQQEGGNFSVDIAYGETTNLPGVGEVLLSQQPENGKVAGPYKLTITSFDGKVGEYMGRLSVAISNKQVSIINLGFSYPLKRKGEEILNAIIQQYMDNNLQDRNTIADSTIAFIENRLLYVGQELGDVEGNIQEFRQNRQLADMSAQSQMLLQNSNEYVKQLTELEVQLDILDTVSAILTNGANERVLPNAIIPDDAVFGGQVTRYNSLLLERDKRLLSATPDNPAVINLNQQLNTLRQDMLANLNNTRSRLIITRNNLRQKTGQLDRQVREVPAIERTYLNLARQQQIRQQLYIFLLQRREETAISKTATISNSRVIDPPKAAGAPFSPKRNMVLLTGILIGLAIPFATIYILDLTNTRIESREDISKQTQVSIIGEIAHSSTKETLVVTPSSRTAIAEQFRALRTNLTFYLKDPDAKAILLTSSMSGEGKSFVALNMAMVFALSGKRVVVMEMDLRKPNLSAKLDFSNQIGFTNYVIDPTLAPMDIVAPSGAHKNLFLIGSGPIPPNPAETLLSERLGELMTALRASFDFIIIDTPPIGLVTDAQLLSHHADLSIYVVRQGRTFKNQLQITEDLYRSGKMKNLAILINDVGTRGGRYGYGYGYGHGYGYYDNGRKDRPWWKFWTRS
ncbi:polysaccharide biosynthesis tyrosine autokinase [Parapedobacter sp. ISTM3]|uniref:GumC family protein n=1 Tax=Parapedobacter sp. ISTM3 TaxID=2800130 RepID=UPI001903ADAD|nr:tyrosine-protein kinase [Parapedobacter sp. ISTM3]MBK1441645.1 polysaccharide biosynthesis tyrosine autokinase [Parapedobacter sp. ISTM3]